MMGSFIDKHLVLNPFIVKAKKIKILENKNYNSKVFLRLENQLISLWMMIKYDYDVDDKTRKKMEREKYQINVDPNTQRREIAHKKRERKKLKWISVIFFLLNLLTITLMHRH